MALSWLLTEPRQALSPSGRTAVSTGEALLASFSALFSAALAESVIVPAAARDFLLGVVSYLIAYFLLMLYFRQLSRIAGDDVPARGDWLRAGAWALLPVHLLLPAALLGRPFAVYGLLFYEAVKLGILVVLVRRCAGALRILTGWPAWAAFLMVLSPFLLGAVALLFMASLVMMAAGLGLLALVS